MPTRVLPRSAPPRALLLALACALLAGCAHGPVVRQRPAQPLSDAWGLAVYPVVFRFPVRPFEAYERARRLAEQLSVTTSRQVYGPGEFRVDDVDDDDPRRGTNLFGALKFSKQRRPEGLYAVRFVVEKRVRQGSSQTFDSQGRQRANRQSADAVQVAVHAELLSLGQHQVVAEVEGFAEADLFSDELERDPFPDVSRLSAQLADALVDAAGLRAAKPRPTFGLATRAVPGPALAFAFRGLPSLHDELKPLDAIEQDSRLLLLFRQLDPDAPRPRVRLYKQAPFGLVVVSSEGAAKAAGLQPDDLLLKADGEALSGRYVLERHLAVGPVKLLVRRAGEETELEFAPSEG